MKTPLQILRRLRKDPKGTTATEFAMIMPSFAMLLFAVFEVSLMFFVGAVMEGAVMDAARQIKTGQAQESPDALGRFSEELCSSSFTIMDCSRLQWDVRAFDDFGSADSSYSLTAEGGFEDAGFNPGESGEIVVARVGYLWEFKTPLIGEFFSDMADGRMLIATAVFKNEPYAGPGGG